MKVLSFSYCFPNHVSPTWGVFVFQRLAAIAAREELQVVSPVPAFPFLTRLRGWPGPVTETWQGLTVHRPRFFCFPGILKSLDGRLYARGLRPWLDRLARKWRPDVLDAHFVWPDGVGVGQMARTLGIPYTITLRGALWVYFRNENIRHQCILALKDAAAIIALSDSMVKTCCDLGVPPEKFTMVHNGVNRSLFRPGDKYEARRKLALPTNGRLVVCVSYYQKRKGIMELVRAMAGLPEDVRLVLVGSNVPTEVAYYRDVLRMIIRLGLSQRVVRVGEQPHERIPDYFQAADVSVLASYWEGCPNAVVESLACGTPVVATPVGSVPEIVLPGQNGLIVPPRQVEPLAEALKRLLDRPPSPEEVRDSPAVRSWDDVAADVCGVLRQAAHSGRLGGGASDQAVPSPKDPGKWSSRGIANRGSMACK